MLTLRRSAYARCGLIGNPSDGYHGKTISLAIKNFHADVVLYEWDEVEMVQTDLDQSRFRSVHDLVRDVKLHGYYGGMRLLKATIKKFVEYCVRNKYDLHKQNFSIRYESTIPRQVGMAGSSAIIIAALRCLMDFYQVQIPIEIQPSLALSVEVEELGIAAGLQDRVAQVYEGLVFMDFSKESMQQLDGYWCGRYEPLDPKLLPQIYVAYNTEVSEPTEIFHNDIRGRYHRGDAMVVAAMTNLAELTNQARDCLINGRSGELGQLMDANFDIRKSIYQLPKDQLKMIEVARECGASAKFAGSGGAILGTFSDNQMYQRLVKELGGIGCKVLQPRIVERSSSKSE